MTVYVERDESGRVKGVYANRQPDYAEEAIEDTHPDVRAYYAPPTDAELAARSRQQAAALAASGDAPGRLARASLLATRDELNVLRAWLTDLKAAVAAATSLADLQARVAELDHLPQRTVAQVKAGLAGAIDSANAD